MSDKPSKCILVTDVEKRRVEDVLGPFNEDDAVLEQAAQRMQARPDNLANDGGVVHTYTVAQMSSITL